MKKYLRETKQFWISSKMHAFQDRILTRVVKDRMCGMFGANIHLKDKLAFSWVNQTIQ